ncbi:MAG: hypothetical protein HXY18_18440 [Bryobacteraceae bacterium]|nr:hypothetical protein [Bryobacteraceae bacterium]
MPIKLGPDWQKMAEAQRVELSEQQRQRLEALGRTMAGLRGLIDWTEEPIIQFDSNAGMPLPAPGGEEGAR